MPERRTVLLALATTLIPLGAGLLIFRAAERSDVCRWTDPIFWIAVVSVAAGVAIFLWLLIQPWLTSRQARQARSEQLQLEGRANQRRGLDEIALELGHISSQLKQELRWGKRWVLFPNDAWTKNQHLVAEEGGVRAAVASAYAQVYGLNIETSDASETELEPWEVQTRQRVKEAVDAAALLITGLRDEIQLNSS